MAYRHWSSAAPASLYLNALCHRGASRHDGIVKLARHQAPRAACIYLLRAASYGIASICGGAHPLMTSNRHIRLLSGNHRSGDNGAMLS